MNYSAFDNLDMGIIIMNADNGRILYGNRLAKRTISDEQIEKFKAHLAERGGFKYEYSTLKDGNTVWYELRCSALPEEGAGLLCITLMDITEYKRAGSDLTHIIQSVPGGLVILTVDDELSISYANSGYYEMLGYSESEFWELFGGKSLNNVYEKERGAFLSSLYEQIADNDIVHLEVGLVRRTGERVHICCDGSYARKENRLYCVLVDISAQKEMILKLNEEMKLNQIIFGLSSDIFFNLDLRRNEITYSENVSGTFDMANSSDNFPGGMLEAGIVAVEDTPEFLRLSHSMLRGEKVVSELRLRNRCNELGWYCFEYDFLYDSEHRPIKAVGRITDISGQKDLKEKALLDPLTGLYNKTETENAIEKCIGSASGSEEHAFMIVDIDNFKGVNDTLGHHFGDTVLTDISGKISRLFTKQDIVGRIGGDEFAIFIRNIRDGEAVEEKAAQIANAFRHTFTGESNNYKISGSIGIALYPKDGRTYESLYKKADRAMYESKHGGKDRYTFFSNELGHRTFSQAAPIEEMKRYDSEYYKGHLLYTVFDLLYETKDIYVSINKVLEIVGQKFAVDRCYIFEAAENGAIFNNTYEWCREGIEPQLEALQNLSREELEYALCRYGEDGIFVCDDPKALGEELFDMLNRQGIKSMLHCGVPGKGEIKAIVGFDDCRAVRKWNEGDISTLTYISRLLGMYLINKEISDELRGYYSVTA